MSRSTLISAVFCSFALSAFVVGTTPAAAQEMAAPYLRAEVRTDTAVWVHLMNHDLPIAVSDWQLTDAEGTAVPLASVLPNTRDTALLTPASPIDPRRVYYAAVPSLGLKVRVRFDGWFRTLYSDKALGATIAEDGASTTFRVFAPRATGVKLYLYDDKDDKPDGARESIAMTRDSMVCSKQPCPAT